MLNLFKPAVLAVLETLEVTVSWLPKTLGDVGFQATLDRFLTPLKISKNRSKTKYFLKFLSDPLFYAIN